MPKRDLVRRANQMPAGAARTGGATVIIQASSASNADRVDGLHASTDAQPGVLLALGSDGMWPESTIPNVVDLADDYTWTGDHIFQGGLTTHDILPEAPDTYDLGSVLLPWRKAHISELDAVVFAEQTAALVGGWLIVPHDQGVLTANVAAADLTVDFGRAMTPGDFVVLRTVGAVEYMSVGTLVAGTVYNVTRNLDGSGANDWPAGTVYLVLGQTGDGRIELNAQDTPRISVLQQGAIYNAQTEVVRIGDLDGSFGVAAERYGIGIGDYAGGNYLRYEPVGGLTLESATGELQIKSDGFYLRGDHYAEDQARLNLWIDGDGFYDAVRQDAQSPEGRAIVGALYGGVGGSGTGPRLVGRSFQFQYALNWYDMAGTIQLWAQAAGGIGGSAIYIFGDAYTDAVSGIVLSPAASRQVLVNSTLSVAGDLVMGSAESYRLVKPRDSPGYTARVLPFADRLVAPCERVLVSSGVENVYMQMSGWGEWSLDLGNLSCFLKRPASDYVAYTPGSYLFSVRLYSTGKLTLYFSRPDSAMRIHGLAIYR